MTDPKRELGLVVAQIFLLRAEFSHREDALSLPPNTPLPEVAIDVDLKVFGKPDAAAAGMTIRARTKDEERHLYRFLVEVTGIIQQVPGQENMPPFEYAVHSGVSALFPFVRDAVATLTMRGRFGPIWLKPFNIKLAVDGLTAQAEARGLLAADSATEPSLADATADASKAKRASARRK